MKSKILLGSLAVAMVLLLAAPASAHEYRRGDSDHPLRYIAYVAHPFGVAVEYVVLRPLHKLFSRDPLTEIVGHHPIDDERYPGWANRRQADNPEAYQPLFANYWGEDED